ncbi:hypothetical protein [Segatella salivae]|uniref:Uncharacterized protein n=1 Tax=Segatella salivae DSM 15606 TaxID=888832 RepID=E6MQB7_9BACT|nr:hypothetical protein [Segatella salivae]EFV04198.1 hypothetical protein HMPREF9420_1685 [Segatella salivae DSM 15606]
MTGFHKFHAIGTMPSINFCSHFMGSRHTKVSTKPLPTGGIIKLTATAMQASELPRKIICCQQRIVSAAETQTSHLPKENIFCQQRIALVVATQASHLPKKNIYCRQRIVSAAATQASYLPKKNICCRQRIASAAATQASEPLKDLKTYDLNKASTTTKTLRYEII